MKSHEELDDIMRTYLIVAAIALGVVAIGAYVISGRLLRPIRDLRDAARDIGESDLTRRITATGNDDLTDLTVTFNDMLDRLDGAFSTQRQFLDDVGHELKTPITIVRGHLELMDSTDVDEVAATRELVLDEMDRMGRLVEELILLAKTRRPDFVHLEPTDLGALTDILLDKMRGLGDSRLAGGRARVGLGRCRLSSASPRRCCSSPPTRCGIPRTGDVIAVGSRLAGRTALAVGTRHRRGDRRRAAGPDLRTVPPRHRPTARAVGWDLRSCAGSPRRMAASRTWSPSPARVPRSPSSFPAQAESLGVHDEPHPDRRGRAADLSVHREGAAGRGLYPDRCGRRRSPRSTMR